MMQSVCFLCEHSEYRPQLMLLKHIVHQYLIITTHNS